MLVNSTDYDLLHVGDLVQLEPDKLIDLRTQLDSLAGNKVGIVCQILSVNEIFHQMERHA